MNKIKILMMIDEAELGGGQVHLLSLIKGINRNIFDISLISEKEGWLIEQIKKLDIKFYPLRLKNFPDLFSLIKLIFLLRKIKPDIIHTHGGTAGFYGRVAGLFFAETKKIHTFHGIHYLNENLTLTKKIFRFIDRLLLNITDRTICVSDGDELKGIEAGVTTKAKNLVIYNGIDIDKFNYPEKIFSEDEIIIGSIGRLHYQKGFEYLIKAAHLLITKYPNITFRIAGDGELSESLINLTKSLKIENKFKFVGLINNVPEFLSKIDIFVLPSLWEGLPIVLLEAMAAKKPIIATDVSGNNELIFNNIDGILVPSKDPEALANSIELLIKNADLRENLAKNAYEKVCNKYGLKQMINNTENLYLKLMEQRFV